MEPVYSPSEATGCHWFPAVMGATCGTVDVLSIIANTKYPCPSFSYRRCLIGPIVSWAWTQRYHHGGMLAYKMVFSSWNSSQWGLMIILHTLYIWCTWYIYCICFSWLDIMLVYNVYYIPILSWSFLLIVFIMLQLIVQSLCFSWQKIRSIATLGLKHSLLSMYGAGQLPGLSLVSMGWQR